MKIPLTIDLQHLADCNPDAAGELAMTLLPSAITSRCRRTAAPAAVSYTELGDTSQNPREQAIITHLQDLMMSPGGENPIDYAPLIIRLPNGIYAAYLCDHDPDVVILVPHEHHPAGPEPDNYLMLRSTDAKCTTDWTADTYTP